MSPVKCRKIIFQFAHNSNVNGLHELKSVSSDPLMFLSDLYLENFYFLSTLISSLGLAYLSVTAVFLNVMVAKGWNISGKLSSGSLEILHNFNIKMNLF